MVVVVSVVAKVEWNQRFEPCASVFLYVYLLLSKKIRNKNSTLLLLQRPENDKLHKYNKTKQTIIMMIHNAILFYSILPPPIPLELRVCVFIAVVVQNNNNMTP